MTDVLVQQGPPGLAAAASTISRPSFDAVTGAATALSSYNQGSVL